MTLLTKLYVQCAEDCVREAERTNDPKYREQLLKWALHWRGSGRRRNVSREEGHAYAIEVAEMKGSARRTMRASCCAG
jgi:hypothetical protein